jgi:alpha-tubulin suppressor-like RCC1 family protein
MLIQPTKFLLFAFTFASLVPLAITSVANAQSSATSAVKTVSQFFGTTAQLSAGQTAPSTNAGVTWVSSDPAIASVSDSGLVTLKRPGQVTVSAKAGVNIISTTTVRVEGFGSVIASRKQHTCATSESLTQIYCWGDQYANTYNRGEAEPDLRTSYQPKPLNMGAIPQGTKIKQIVPDFRASCVLTDLGDAYCWNNIKPSGADVAVVGAGTSTGSATPVKVVQGERPDSVTFTKLSISGQKVCGLGSDGKLYCWGANTRLLPTANKAASTPMLTAPVQMASTIVPADEKLIDLGVAANHICVLTDKGKLFCNIQGALKAIDVAALNPGTTLTQMSANTWSDDLFGLLASDGSAYVLGKGSGLLFGSENTALASMLTFRKVAQGDMPVSSKAMAISRGDTRGLGCVALQSGAVHCWGNSYLGQTPNGPHNYSTDPAPVKIQQGEIPATTKILDIHCGSFHCAAYGSDRLIYSWGFGEADALGRANLSTTGSPAPILVATPTSNQK